MGPAAPAADIRDDIGISHRVVTAPRQGTTGKVRLAAVSRSKELITPRHILEMLAKDFDEPSDSSTPLSVEDRLFIQLLDQQTVVDDDGHYSMPLPLRPNIAELPQNRHVAIKRLLGLCGASAKTRRTTKNTQFSCRRC